MRIVFMGTPSFAVPSLQALLDSGHAVVGVFTQPDKPVGRKQILQPPPVKETALAAGIPVYQPATLKDGAALAILQDLQPDLIAVAAYGKILPPAILELPRYGCVNVHASLLPKYRGAAPIQWCVLNGEPKTGVTMMHMAEGLDTGDIISQAETPIDPDETAGELQDRLAVIGAKLLVDTLPALEAGTAPRTPQEDSLSCYASMLTKALSPIDWSKSAWEIHCKVRGLAPWPSATAVLDGVHCKILKTKQTDRHADVPAGTVVQADKKGLLVACGDGSVLEILELQPDGKKPMAAAAFLLGHPLKGTLA